ncbi:hypothetical protein BO70DRAFT_27638 [Aspergillus heteromorphus CBS 117.55]|uniref:Uncharacterized protein n=1 Tax=Aspergillus heteromorphus CBS 117.55 TaxID=1448321 RepID=A0A317WEU4_9EURO|nr:uncharacterized protein BO70DRAFT_27638 [Aspergillus heteromorphus CBS 117.55]PWY83528.1 hypothetical protein BO70DRAFT_27638 [Aspergillus heteromorphus CBS 117.55]
MMTFSFSSLGCWVSLLVASPGFLMWVGAVPYPLRVVPCYLCSFRRLAEDHSKLFQLSRNLIQSPIISNA